MLMLNKITFSNIDWMIYLENIPISRQNDFRHYSLIRKTIHLNNLNKNLKFLYIRKRKNNLYKITKLRLQTIKLFYEIEHDSFVLSNKKE